MFITFISITLSVIVSIQFILHSLDSNYFFKVHLKYIPTHTCDNIKIGSFHLWFTKVHLPQLRLQCQTIG